MERLQRKCVIKKIDRVSMERNGAVYATLSTAHRKRRFFITDIEIIFTDFLRSNCSPIHLAFCSLQYLLQ